MDTKEAYKLMSDALKVAHQSIESVYAPELNQLKATILTPLQQQINRLDMHLGFSPTGEIEGAIKGKKPPMKKIMGRTVGSNVKPIETKPLTVKEFAKVNKEISEDHEVLELRSKVDRLMPYFLNISDEKLKDENDEMVIRAIAKRAGLPVTETEPERVDVKLIRQIKEALKVVKDKETPSEPFELPL